MAWVNGTGLLGRLLVCLGLGMAIAPSAAGFEWSAVNVAPFQLAQGSETASGTEAEQEFVQLLIQGRAAYQAEDFAQAQRLWKGAVTAAQEQGFLEGEGLSLSLVALAAVRLGQLDEAAIALERGSVIVPQLPEYKQLGLEVRLTMAQGQLALAQGDGQRAVSEFQKAEKMHVVLGDRIGEVGAAFNTAAALHSLGLYQRGLRVLLQQRSLLSGMAARSPEVAAKGWLSLGNSFRQLGQYEEALAALGRSREISKGITDGGPIEAVELSLGLTHLAIAQRARAAGEGAVARQGKRDALQFLRVGAERSPELKVRSQLALVEAERFPRRRLSGVEQEGAFQGWLALQSTLEAMPPTRRSIAVGLEWVRHGWETYDWGVDPAIVQTALVGQLKRLATAAEQLGDLRSQSQVLGTLGEIYGRAGRSAEAELLWRRSLRLANSANAPDAAYRWHWFLGKSLAKSGDRDEALRQYRRAFELVQQLRKDLVGVSETVQFSFRDRVEPVYRELTALLLEDAPSQKDLGEARQVIEALQLARLDNFFRQACLDVEPEFLDRTIDRQTDAASIYSIVLDNQVASIKRPGAPLEHFVTSVPKAEFEGAVRRLSRSFQNPALPTQQRLALSQRIYQWLLAPVVPALEAANIETLVMVLDGELGNIPVAALHDGDRYIIEKFNLARSPSLQLLPPSADTNQSLSASVAGISAQAPSFTAEGLVDLPFVGLELDAIGDRFPGKVLADAEVTKTALRSEILRGRNGIIHIATHAQFSSNADQTFLLTWDQRIGVDGLDALLQPGDRRDAIELLVLSACETASGDPRATLGLTGIAIQAGARSVLGTLWQVSDASTAELMARFYDYLQGGMTKAEALSQAQRDLLNDPEFRHPFYWAPYILVGNWR